MENNTPEQKPSGIELISKERKEQLEKHGRTIRDDVRFNKGRQLASAAKRLIEIDADPLNAPYDWDTDIWQRMCRKPYQDRLIIAGALIAAEIDRLNHSDNG
jgi:hypothetical protein